GDGFLLVLPRARSSLLLFRGLFLPPLFFILPAPRVEDRQPPLRRVAEVGVGPMGPLGSLAEDFYNLLNHGFAMAGLCIHGTCKCRRRLSLRQVARREFLRFCRIAHNRTLRAHSRGLPAGTRPATLRSRAAHPRGGHGGA